MKYIVIADHDPNIFPGMFYLARQLADAGHDVIFFATHEPVATGWSLDGVRYINLPKPAGFSLKIPLVRSNYHRLFACFLRERPDWIVAQHQYTLPSAFFRLLSGGSTRMAACFVDFHGERRYLKAMKPLAGMVDLYADVCDLRVDWMRQAWPRLGDTTFVARNAPLRQPERPLEPHQGVPKVVLTASVAMTMHYTSPDRFSRFATRLCGHGISLDWYTIMREDQRAQVYGLCTHPLFTVHDPLPKTRLIEELRGYDVGLFWAPMADADLSRAPDRSIFISAASNKIAEYMSAGLMVAHSGNPGLAYLPSAVSVAFDPTDPEAAADRLAAAIFDREAVERARLAAWNYHRNEMNFEAQFAPLIDVLLQPRAGR